MRNCRVTFLINGALKKVTVIMYRKNFCGSVRNDPNRFVREIWLSHPWSFIITVETGPRLRVTYIWPCFIIWVRPLLYQSNSSIELLIHGSWRTKAFTIFFRSTFRSWNLGNSFTRMSFTISGSATTRKGWRNIYMLKKLKKGTVSMGNHMIWVQSEINEHEKNHALTY